MIMKIKNNKKRAKWKDKEVVKAVEEIKNARVNILRENEWKIEEELVLNQKRERYIYQRIKSSG